MKNKFTYYAIVWAIMIAVFNVVVFFVRPVIPGYVIGYDARFWVAWSFIIVAFIVNLICAFIAFKATNLRKMFYNVSLIRISYTGVVLMLVAGTILMIVPDCPVWISVIVCVILLGFNVSAVVGAKAAADTVKNVDSKIGAQTRFVKSLTADANSIMAYANTNEAKNACTKVYDALRYSDPMSSDAVAEIETQIAVKFGQFSNAVKNGGENTIGLAEELVAMIVERNKKSKVLKKG